MGENPAFDLLGGLVAVFDDDLDDENSAAAQIVDQLEREKFRCVKYKEPPSQLQSSDTLDILHSISFFILDWKFDRSGVSIPDTAIISQRKSDIQNLKQISPAPIFIITNEKPDDIKESLSLDEDEKLIFVKQKSELNGLSLLDEIFTWINSNTHVSVLLQFRKDLRDALNQTLGDLYCSSSRWADHLLIRFHYDGINKYHELGYFLRNIVKNRMRPLEVNSIDFESLLESHDVSATDLEKNNLLHIYETEKYLDRDVITNEQIRCGDCFKIDKTYFINVTPNCDSIPRSDSPPEIQLIKYKPVTLKNLSKQDILVSTGNRTIIKDRVDRCTIFPFHNGKAMQVYLNEIRLENIGNLSDSRVGRLLPPYLHQILYARMTYLIRPGLPPFPDFLFPDLNDSESGS